MWAAVFPTSPTSVLVWSTAGLAYSAIVTWRIRTWICVRWWYLLVPTAAASLAAALFAGSDVLAAWWWLSITGTALVTIDLHQHRLPHRWMLLTASGGIGAFVVDAIGSNDATCLLRSATAGTLVLGGGVVIGNLFPSGPGMGDYMLLSTVALYAGWISWTTVTMSLFVSLLLFGLVAAGSWLFGYRAAQTSIAAGPSLLLGGWLVMAIAH